MSSQIKSRIKYLISTYNIHSYASFIGILKFDSKSITLLAKYKMRSSGADSIGHGAHVPHFYKWLGTGGTVSRRTANKKLTKLY